jgi:acetyl esterase
MSPFAVVAAFLLAGAVSAAPVDRKDVEFGQPGGKKLYLDLHVPDGTGPFPAAILVHGGGF